MATTNSSAEGDSAFVAASASRRHQALMIAAAVVDSFAGRAVLTELPASAPLAPTCVIDDAASGARLVVVSSNGAATSLLVGPEASLIELPDVLDQSKLDAMLEAALREVIEVLLHR